jgi:hypothetical protein
MYFSVSYLFWLNLVRITVKIIVGLSIPVRGDYHQKVLG